MGVNNEEVNNLMDKESIFILKALRQHIIEGIPRGDAKSLSRYVYVHALSKGIEALEERSRE